MEFSDTTAHRELVQQLPTQNLAAEEGLDMGYQKAAAAFNVPIKIGLLLLPLTYAWAEGYRRICEHGSLRPTSTPVARKQPAEVKEPEPKKPSYARLQYERNEFLEIGQWLHKNTIANQKHRALTAERQKLLEDLKQYENDVDAIAASTASATPITPSKKSQVLESIRDFNSRVDAFTKLIQELGNNPHGINGIEKVPAIEKIASGNKMTIELSAAPSQKTN